MWFSEVNNVEDLVFAILGKMRTYVTCRCRVVAFYDCVIRCIVYERSAGRLESLIEVVLFL